MALDSWSCVFHASGWHMHIVFGNTVEDLLVKYGFDSSIKENNTGGEQAREERSVNDPAKRGGKEGRVRVTG